jgi:hypothetical protein
MNSYYTIRIKIVWIGTKTTLCTNSYYTICITIVWIHLYEFVRKLSKKIVSRLGFQPGTNIQYRTCNGHCVCHPPPPHLSQWPFYLYTVQLRKSSEKRDCTIGQLRKPSEKRDCTNSFLWHIVNSQSHIVLHQGVILRIVYGKGAYYDIDNIDSTNSEKQWHTWNNTVSHAHWILCSKRLV